MVVYNLVSYFLINVFFFKDSNVIEYLIVSSYYVVKGLV